MAIKVAGTTVISDDRNLNNVGIITASSIVKSSGTSSQFLKADGSVDSNAYVTSSGSVASATDATNAANVAITNDTSSTSTHYVHIGDATTGNDGVKVSNTKLTFQPSTGTLTATCFSGDGSGLTGVSAGFSQDADGNLFGGTGAGGSYNASSGTACLNIAIGCNAGGGGSFGSGGDYNIFLGEISGYCITSGCYNVAIGRCSGHRLTTASGNSFLGRYAGERTTGNNNSFLGINAGRYNTSGCCNVFLGVNSGYCNGAGNDNVAVGKESLRFQTSGNNNSAVGDSSLYCTTGGDYNSALGFNAGRCNLTGCCNTFLGVSAGCNLTSGNSNVAIGADIDFPSTTASCQFVVGQGTNYWLSGDSSFNLGVGGITSPAAKLHVACCAIISPTSASASNRLTIKSYTTNNGTLSVEGNSGQVFSVNNNLSSGSIFSVNDISGIAKINVDASGTTTIVPTIASDYLGVGVANPTAKLHVVGSVFLDGGLREKVNVVSNRLSSSTNINLEDGMVHLFTVAENTTSTPNIRYNSSTSLNSVMGVGEAITVSLITTAASAGYSAQLTIDGSSQTEYWNGGSAPSTGGASGRDIYTYTIIKTASGVYTVLANLTNFS